ncbi:hypothetical protein J5N58_01700 [Rhizobium cremeum]|uniref:hypothetical protein n=1 Tax=Rhizobium cremeum TaxID=2813827 RepID=UPI001FD5546E|nr:hypothetical protein [Rhizobium cremeum]MCJ7993311.1 hypothetical protein [Rhizobium cremeum]MCJ7998376.1 hypothetical protein [Rhizobium cremeum]
MSNNLIISLSFVLLAALCIIGGVTVIARIKYNPSAGTEIEIPLIGKIRTDYPALGVIFLGVVFAFFAYDLSRVDKIEMVHFDGKISIDPRALNDISAVVVGVTTSPWTQTGTPDRSSGTMEITIPVPSNWNNYTAYAFAHGLGTVRPAVIGLRRDQRNFKLDLER